MGEVPGVRSRICAGQFIQARPLLAFLPLESGGIVKPGFHLSAIAQEVKAAQDNCRRLEPFTSRLKGFSNADAYAVANLVHEMRIQEGARPVGRKIGFTNPEMWSLYGVREPIWAHIYDTTVVRLTGPKARCHIGRFAEPKIEPEIVMHFRTAPPEGADPAQLLECIDWIAHGIEIVQSHFPGWIFRAADTIADWALHATLLVGEPMDVGRLSSGIVSALEDFTITLSCNGEVRERGQGANALGSPLLAVAHLIAAMAKQTHALPLQAGELVTTGTLTAAPPIEAGQTWSTVLDGIALHGIRVSLES